MFFLLCIIITLCNVYLEAGDTQAMRTPDSGASRFFSTPNQSTPEDQSGALVIPQAPTRGGVRESAGIQRGVRFAGRDQAGQPRFTGIQRQMIGAPRRHLFGSPIREDILRDLRDLSGSESESDSERTPAMKELHSQLDELEAQEQKASNPEATDRDKGKEEMDSDASLSDSSKDEPGIMGSINRIIRDSGSQGVADALRSRMLESMQRNAPPEQPVSEDDSKDTPDATPPSAESEDLPSLSRPSETISDDEADFDAIDRVMQDPEQQRLAAAARERMQERFRLGLEEADHDIRDLEYIESGQSQTQQVQQPLPGTSRPIRRVNRYAFSTREERAARQGRMTGYHPYRRQPQQQERPRMQHPYRTPNLNYRGPNL